MRFVISGALPLIAVAIVFVWFARPTAEVDEYAAIYEPRSPRPCSESVYHEAKNELAYHETGSDMYDAILEQVHSVGAICFVSEAGGVEIPVVQEGGTLRVVDPDETELNYIAFGHVQAGIDLSQITRDSIREEEGVLYIDLPLPRITDVGVNLRKQLFYQVGHGFTDLAPDAPALSLKLWTTALVDSVCEAGILEAVNKQAAAIALPLVSQIVGTPVFFVDHPIGNDYVCQETWVGIWE